MTMSNELANWNSGQSLGTVGGLTIMPPSPHSRLGRSISRTYGSGLDRAAEIDVDANVTNLKVGAAINLSRSAQTEIAMMSQVEQQLSEAVPGAAERLKALGTLASIEVTNILSGGLNTIRRM
jgi:hypothetical protein